MNLAITKLRLPNRIKITFFLIVGCLLLFTNLTNRSHASSTVEDFLGQSRSKYAALKTYSDTGTVKTELVLPGNTDPATIETHTFTTFYRAPRQYFFEFKKDPNVGDERFVIWADTATSTPGGQQLRCTTLTLRVRVTRHSPLQLIRQRIRQCCSLQCSSHKQDCMVQLWI